MRIEKKTLNDALRVLGKVVCQTSPVELYRSIRFVGDVDGVMAMATDGVETVSVAVDAFTESEIDFSVPFKELKDLVRMGRSETIELSGTYIEFPELEEPSADAVSAILLVNFGELLAQDAPIVDRSGYRRALRTWDNLFQIEIGNFSWHGKLLEGQYPNWRGSRCCCRQYRRQAC